MTRFSGFVIVAEMRTGSNLLESILNALPCVSCHGELFNRNFIGRPNRLEAFGIDEAAREADPAQLLLAMDASGTGMHGFRWFPDHDARVLPMVLGDPRRAIIRLRRNPAEVWVSRQIARATGQWKLGDLKHRKAARISFVRSDFVEYLNNRDVFDRDFRRQLQIAGRTAFDIEYSDLGNLDVLNGLAAWLGTEDRLTALPTTFRKQNPGELRDKVENWEEMAAALQELGVPEGGGGHFRAPPGAAVPGWMAAARAPLLFQPIDGGPLERIARWLETVDGEPAASGLRQRTLRDWQDAHQGYRAFTVLRHPLMRAYAALREPRPEGLSRTLARYRVEAEPVVTAETLVAWLEFLGGVLAGQTSLRPRRSWRHQTELVAAACAVRPPDWILREEELEAALPTLGSGVAPPPDPQAQALRDGLSEIVTDQAERIARRVYRADFRAFGFSDWRSGGG